MHISDILKKKETFWSCEVMPPEKGKNINELYSFLDSVINYSPSFVSVTYHQEELVYKKVNGKIKLKHPLRKKPGTVEICGALRARYNIETVPHLICGGFNKYETEGALIGLNFLGISNVLALRGDPQKKYLDNGKGELELLVDRKYRKFNPEKDGHRHASDLVEQIVNLKKGIYLNMVEKGEPAKFCVGVAGYPEKHHEAKDIKEDMQNLKIKIDKGACYIITQMFFDNDKYRGFVKTARDIGINVPILPGIKMLSSKKQLTLLPKIFQVSIPEDLKKEMEKYGDDTKKAEQIGIEYAVEQCKDLIKCRVPCLHFYTMNKKAQLEKVLKAVL